MTIILPASYPRQPMEQVLPGRPILSNQPAAVVEGQHHIYANQRAVTSPFDIDFATASTAYTQDNAAELEGLDSYWPILGPFRERGDGNVGVRVDVFGRSFDFRCSVLNADDLSLITTFTIVNLTGAFVWDSETELIPAGNISGDFVILNFEARDDSVDRNFAVRNITPSEAPIESAADLP